MTHLSVAREPMAARLSQSVSRQRWLTPALVYAALIVLCALAGYWLMFSQFAVYDDEGFFDYSLRLFLAGHPLYSSVSSTYGPFYYLVFGGLFSVLGHGVTTDSGRLVQLTIWIVTTLGLGVTAHRLTGRLSIGVAALATSFLLLNALTSEPMHTSALICLLLTLMAAVLAFVVPRRSRAGLVAVGAIAAALVLSKINVGGYAVISIAFAAVMAGGVLLRYTLLRWLVAAAFVLVGPVVMAGHLNSGWVRGYAVLAVASSLALVLVALPTRIDSAQSDDSARWPRFLVAGFAACLVVVVAILLALGTSPRALVDQIIVEPTHQGSFLTIPLSLDGDAMWWSLGAVAAAWTWRQVALSDATRQPSAWNGALRILAGVAILLSLGNASVFSIAPNATFSLAVALAWVAAVPTCGETPCARRRLVRLMIPSLAILQTLVAYPVAGTQVMMSSILLVLCGAVCLGDGWSELATWSAVRRSGSPLAASALTAVFAVLAVGSVFNNIIQPLEVDHNQYRAGAPLSLPGAVKMRLPPVQGEPLQQVVKLLHSRNCTTLISLPGMYSFNIWAGLPTPRTLQDWEAYWKFMSQSQQLAVVREVQASRGVCVVRNDTQAAADGGAPISSPLVNFIEREFVPVATLPPYTVEVRRS